MIMQKLQILKKLLVWKLVKNMTPELAKKILALWSCNVYDGSRPWMVHILKVCV